MKQPESDASWSTSEAWEILAGLREAVLVCDPEDRIAYVNVETERLLGFSASDLAGTPADALHPERLKLPGTGILRAIARRSISTGGQSERTVLLRSDGLELEVEALAALRPVHGSELVVASFRRLPQAVDLTRRAGRVSPTELEAYRLVFDHARLGISHFDERGVVSACNDFMCTILGSTKRVLIGLNLLTLEDPRMLAAVREALSGKIGRFEGDYRVATSGKKIAIVALFAPVRDENGVVLGGVGMIEDISKQRSAETAALRSEEQFRTLIHAAPDGVAVHRDGRLVFVNPAFVSMLGHESPEELLDRRVSDLLEPDQHAELERRTRTMLQLGQPLPAWEQRMKRRDGAELTVEVASLPLHFDGKSAILELARDVTERKLIEARLAQADRLASVGTLAAGVAHEINNPLAYALGSVEVAQRQLSLLRAAIPDRKDLEPVLAILGDCLNNASEGNERVRVIVRDLMTFSRARAESRALLDVEAVLESAVNLAWNEIRHRARLLKRYAGTPPVLADEARLGQVFLNLILNAAQAMPEGKVSDNEIRLFTSFDGERVVVVVEDTGSGIASDHLGRIFEPFFSTKLVGGTGLGLSICHGIVEGLGGKIEVETAAGRGSRFSVILPAAGVTERPARVLTPPVARRVARARILVIDDEPMIAETLQMALAEHEVVAVDTGTQALELLALDPAFDLVLCDLMMPELSGAGVYDQVKHSSRELAERFVFMTGGAFTPNARTFLEGFEGRCLEKPFAVDRILALLVERQS